MVVELDNHVLGEYVKGDNQTIIRDAHGNDALVIYNVLSSDLRRIKRRFPYLQEELSKIPVTEIISLIKRAMLHYYEDNERLALCSKVTGSPLWFLEAAVDELRDWVSNMEEYLRLSLGHYDYEKVPIIYEGRMIAYQSFAASSPLIAILPRNSELESAYVVIQGLIARTPMIIKGPNQQGSILSCLEFISALKKAAGNEHETIFESLNIVNIIEDDKSRIMERLAYDNATYLVFGSNETIMSVERQLQNYHPRKIIKMGTGFSMSVVFEDYDANIAARQICDSASIDRGNDCISTNIVYAHRPIAELLFKKIIGLLPEYESGDPLSPSKVGSIHEQDIRAIHERTSHLGASCRGAPDNVHLSVFMLEEHHHFEEYPGPVLGIRVFDGPDDLKAKYYSDMSHNMIRKNLVTSVFTNRKESLDFVVRNFMSHTIKHNRGSHKMNFLLEHQGLYLIREILERRIVEVEEKRPI